MFSTWQLEVLEGLFRRSSLVDQGRMEVVARHLTLPTKSDRTGSRTVDQRLPGSQKIPWKIKIMLQILRRV